MNVLVMNGPNLNLLGEREPSIYGAGTLANLEAQLRTKARELGIELRMFQSNHEGALIDRLHAERQWMEGLIINPGALTHTSYPLREAIWAVKVRAIEVHLSDIRRREAFRRVSVVKRVCEAQISGKGFRSYLEALERLAQQRSGKNPNSVR
jgi:3-dehydroquinate dehydratase-2